MNIEQRVERVRELTKDVSALPWSRDTRGRIVDASGGVIFDPVAFDPQKGSAATNDPNSEMVEHLSHVVHEDFMVVVPEMRTECEVGMLQKKVFDQANRLFPRRTPALAFMKLYEELGEVIKDPHDELEWADVFILMFDLSKMYGVDIRAAVEAKMAVNDGREWVETATGTLQHTDRPGTSEPVTIEVTIGKCAPGFIMPDDSPAMAPVGNCELTAAYHKGANFMANVKPIKTLIPEEHQL